ncbi:hypothetical protein TRL7639_01414 [Falsiruegeria litorea R37]|uniref:Uncharacterized protein n=1 Tax=Falsiruegeria litorea R37 TaxID=1200284 RepID=A0A1Y5S4W2_9RHOB|nr:hypothetical protein [Falsiruegeria litorea]SLN32669.1 hypothetical protein TRL7639_01414 [Falsiruegeria litorea R37]
MLSSDGRHELSCSACGAPLHDLKMLRQAKADTAVSHLPKPKVKKPKKARVNAERREKSYVKPKKVKKRKSLMSRFLDEAWDAVEDIFD